MKTSQKSTKIETFDSKFWIIFGLFIVFIIMILSFPYLITTRSWFEIDFSKASGEVGDTIGGILSPFVAIAASILTFLAFWVQFKANEQQKLDLKYERFENKFYELLNLHKNNVEDIKIGINISGRKSFVHLFYELRFIYMIVKDFYESTDKETMKIENYNKIRLIDFSYKIFFFGIGVHSEKYFVNFFSKGEKHLFRKVKQHLEINVQDKYLQYIESSSKKQDYFTYGLPSSGFPNDKTIEFHYFPFDGHVNKLGHYFRHLFQTCNFIINQNFLDNDEKYNYIKTLRAQISDFEQLVIYYNALAWFGEAWEEIFINYRFIKNIPIPMADFDKNPREFYKKSINRMKEKGIEVFDWKQNPKDN